jgi:uridylate kinase
VLAWELCDHLRIEHCWKVMEVLWKCNGETIRKARERGIDTDTVMEFNKKLKNVIY